MISFPEHAYAAHAGSAVRETQKRKRWRRTIGIRAPDGGQLYDTES